MKSFKQAWCERGGDVWEREIEREGNRKRGRCLGYRPEGGDFSLLQSEDPVRNWEGSWRDVKRSQEWPGGVSTPCLFPSLIPQVWNFKYCPSLCTALHPVKINHARMHIFNTHLYTHASISTHDMIMAYNTLFCVC